MAIFRKIHVSFWSDSFISDLDKDKKLFYLYLLTNEKTTQCGIYEITKKQISFDIGYSIDTVSKLLQYFIKINKIRYNEATKEIAIKNWLKYNNSTSPKVQSCINKELRLVKDTLLIQYINSIDTQTQEEQEEEKEEEQEPDEVLTVKTWRDDFEIYKKECREAFIKFDANEVLIEKQQRLNPNVDIKLTIEKAYDKFWSTEAGWANKKKSKSKNIDWEATIKNAISTKSNIVYKNKLF